MNKGIYQHFSIEDRPFLDKGMEWIKKVEDSYAPFLTPFINPHQEKLLKILAKTYGLACSSSGEFVSSEYVRVLLYPDYFQPEFSDFEISLQEICYSNKFEHLTHAKILGTFINQLGIERRTFGDILVVGDRAQLFVDKRLAQYFIDHVSKIAKMPVKLKEVSFAEQLKEQKQAVTREILASSLRLDKLVASTFKLSRSQAAQLISGKHVKMNYAVNDNPSQQVGLEDLISVRRFGRFKVLRENGLSKNGKHKLTVELLASK